MLSQHSSHFFNPTRMSKARKTWLSWLNMTITRVWMHWSTIAAVLCILSNDYFFHPSKSSYGRLHSNMNIINSKQYKQQQTWRSSRWWQPGQWRWVRWWRLRRWGRHWDLRTSLRCSILNDQMLIICHSIGERYAFDSHRQTWLVVLVQRLYERGLAWALRIRPSVSNGYCANCAMLVAIISSISSLWQT